MRASKAEVQLQYQASRCQQAISQMLNNCISDITNREAKQEEVEKMLKERRSKNGKIGLINQLVYETELNENQAILANCIAKKSIK